MAKKKHSLQAIPNEVALAIGQLEKEYGKNSLFRLGDNPFGTRWESQFSTGSVALDLAIGTAWKDEKDTYRLGIPGGKTIEIFGPESSGKTTLCNHIVASAQSQGGLAAFIDVEQTWDRKYAKKVGVDTDNLIFSQPDSGEQALNTVHKLLVTGRFSVIVVDSVASLVPQSEIENGMSDNSMSVQARMMSKALRFMTPKINKTNTLVIFTNQLREKVGVFFGNPEVTPGGNALKFYASLRIDLRKITALKNETGATYGHRTRAKIIKNKMAPPFTEAEFNLEYGVGINKILDIVESASAAGVIEKKGSWYSYGNEQIGQGADSVAMTLGDNEELRNKIKLETIQRWMEGDVEDEPEEQKPDEAAVVTTA